MLRGERMLSHVPLHRSAFDRAPDLRDWIGSWACHCRHEKEQLLTPSGWCEAGHDVVGSRENCDGFWMPEYKSGTFLWGPPPAAARFAVEELRQARLKRQSSMHIFCVPKLLAPEWRRQLFKSADLIFLLPVGHPVWPHEMHEPLQIAVYFPFLNRSPWELRKTRLLVDMARAVPKLLKDSPPLGRDLLSELCLLTGRMDTMPLRELRSVLSGHFKYPQVSSQQSL